MFYAHEYASKLNGNGIGLLRKKCVSIYSFTNVGLHNPQRERFTRGGRILLKCEWKCDGIVFCFHHPRAQIFTLPAPLCVMNMYKDIYRETFSCNTRSRPVIANAKRSPRGCPIRGTYVHMPPPPQPSSQNMLSVYAFACGRSAYTR